MDLVELIIQNLPEILTFALGIVSIILGKKYNTYKTKITHIAELFPILMDAVEDDQITMDEVTKISDQVKLILEE
jgi:hypothetical protein